MRIFVVLIVMFFAVSSYAATPETLSFIEQHEGFSATPYGDGGGQSIGYGHFIKPGEHFTKITKTEAKALLEKDVSVCEASINDNVVVKLTDNQRAALTSFIYNVGVGAFKDSTLLKLLNKGDYAGAKNQFARWNKSQGKIVPALVQRRKDEADLFGN